MTLSVLRYGDPYQFCSSMLQGACTQNTYCAAAYWGQIFNQDLVCKRHVVPMDLIIKYSTENHRGVAIGPVKKTCFGCDWLALAITVVIRRNETLLLCAAGALHLDRPHALAWIWPWIKITVHLFPALSCASNIKRTTFFLPQTDSFKAAARKCIFVRDIDWTVP